MPDLSPPELHLPDLKLPDGLRDLNRHDIQEAIGDRLRRTELPDLSKLDLPKAVADRLPGRKRTNRILPIAAIVAVGMLFVAAWWLITAQDAATRLRTTGQRVRARLTGQETAVERYDDASDLGSLVGDEGAQPVTATESWPDAADFAASVGAGNGASVGH